MDVTKSTKQESYDFSRGRFNNNTKGGEPVRHLTFKGFITEYVKKTSAQNTISIHKILKEATTTNPKLMEPALLYVAIANKANLFLSVANKLNVPQKYMAILETKPTNMSEQTLPQIMTNLPVAYKKVYDKYLDAKKKYSSDDPAKEFYKNEILKIAQKHNLTISAIAKTTGLKRGNAYRFFSKKQDDYLSLQLLQKAYKILCKKYGIEEGDDGYCYKRNT